jgi:hypothetical protein
VGRGAIGHPADSALPAQGEGSGVSARRKLNAAHLLGALLVAGLVGLATGSGLAFTVALGGLLLAGLVARDIR